LDANEAKIEALERLILAFTERYLHPANEAGSALAEHIEAPDQSNSGEDPGPPRLKAHQQDSPNFSGPVRRWLRRS
jgi:hypothetical protein